MPSITKTTTLGLNQWAGNEYPKRADFNNDNAAIDAAFTNHSSNNTKKFSDMEYQVPTLSGAQIRLTRQGDSKRLFFYLSADLSGSITISLDGGVTSVSLKDYDGIQLTSLSKGYQEVVDNTTFFTYAPKNGASGMSKIYKGTNTPSSPHESDIWVKDDVITIEKTIFDKDFSISNSYSTNTLVFYITSNPTDQGYRILADLFGGTDKVDMKVPLFCAAFWDGSMWSYPLIYVYVSGAWTYLSGAFTDNSNRVMAFDNSAVPAVQVNRFTMDGTQDITNKAVLSVSTGYDIQRSACLLIDGSRVCVRRTVSNTSPKMLIATDADGNYRQSLTITLAATHTSSTGDYSGLLADGNYVYLIDKYASYVPCVVKYDITTNTAVLSASLAGVVTYAYINSRGHNAQNANYLFVGSYKVTKYDFTASILGSAEETYKVAGTHTDKNKRVIVISQNSVSVITVKIYSASDYSLVKTISLTLPENTGSSTGGLYRTAIDKDDSLIMWVGGVTNNYIAKYVRDTVNDTWTFLASYSPVTVMSSANDADLLTDINGNIYGTTAANNGTYSKFNPNLQLVYTKTAIGGNTSSGVSISVGPCDISEDYNRQYFK